MASDRAVDVIEDQQRSGDQSLKAEFNGSFSLDRTKPSKVREQVAGSLGGRKFAWV